MEKENIKQDWREELEMYLPERQHKECGDECSKKWYEEENIKHFREEVADLVEKTRREAFREGQNSVHVEAQETNGVVKLNVDYAQNAAQSYINKSQDEWHEMGFKAGYKKAFEDIQDGKEEVL